MRRSTASPLGFDTHAKFNKPTAPAVAAAATSQQESPRRLAKRKRSMAPTNTRTPIPKRSITIRLAER
jgi:hypothetical protein